MEKINGKLLFEAYEKTRDFVSSDDVTEQKFSAIENVFEKKKLNPEATIMIYGVYNAGKSTLINALLGREVASVDDVPTTDRVDTYHWEQYEILDTPGVDAPIQHENVTRAQMLESEAIIFVVDPVGTAEEIKTLSVLIDLVREKKQVFLVFNEKKEISVEEFIKLKDQTRERLQKIAQERGLKNVLKNIPIIKVNAKRALQGKLKNQPKLVDSSGFIEFEKEINKFLQSISSDQVYANLKNQLVSFLDDYADALKKQSKSESIKVYDKMLNGISSQKNKLMQLTLTDLSRQKTLVYEKSKNILRADFSEGKQRIENLLMESNKEISTNLEQRINVFIHEAEAELSEFQTAFPYFMCDDYTCSAGNLVSLDVETSENTHLVPQSQPSSLNTATIEGAVVQITSLAKPEHIVGGLKIVKNTLPSLMKGIGPVTMAKWSALITTKIIPVIGSIVTAVSVLAGFLSSSSEENSLNQQIQEQQEAKERALQQVEDFALEISNNFDYSMRELHLASLESAFAEIFNKVDSMRQAFSESERLSSQLLEQLAKIQMLATSA